MMSRIQFFISSTASLLLLSVGLSVGRAAQSGPAPASADNIDSLFKEAVVATGEGVKVTRSQLDSDFIAFRANLAARDQSISEQQRPVLEARLLDRLIVTQLLSNRATQADKEKAAEVAKKYLDDFKKNLPDEETLVRQLKAVGMTPEQFDRRVTEQALSQVVLERELKSKQTVTDDEIKRFYEQNPEKFLVPEMVKARHILLSTRDPVTGQELSDADKRAKHAQIEKLLARARKGEDFAKLATEYTEDPGSRNNGGEYTFPRGRMVPEFDAAAFSLSAGQISDVVTTTYGYHIIKVEEKMPAHKVPLETASPDIKEFLTNQKLKDAMPAYFDKLKADANVKILDDKLAAAAQEDRHRLEGLPTVDP